VRRTLLICILLTAATLAVFWPVVDHAFVNYDDNCYIVHNPQIQAGLTWQGMAWAFGRLHGDHTYWHPLTWVSHMVDCQLFGTKPAGHHLVSLLFHTLNSLLVFLVFKRLTGAFWRSALLAALFSLHPLQVDSVAWVAERKNLLSATFFLLTIWAYGRYVEVRRQSGEVRGQRSVVSGQSSETPDPVSRITHHTSRFYLVSLGFLALGLMCKPVLVTVPFVLLLLDYWPLGRLRLQTKSERLKTVLLEKLPFLPFVLVSCYITAVGTRAVGSMVDPAAGFPLSICFQNALFSYVKYLGKALWPVSFAVFYPYPDHFPAWRAIACGLLLLAISGFAIVTVRRRPHLLVGWCWFLGVLVPFIGLRQAGEQAMADRFAYVPLIGLLLMVVWGATEVIRRWRRPVLIPAAISIAVLACCAALSRQQTTYWENSVTLFSHALQVTPENARSHSNLGQALAEAGRLEEGIQHLVEATRLNPEHAVAYWAIGSGRVQQGRFEEAIECYETALRLKPDYPEALNNLAWLRATHPNPRYRNGSGAVELAERSCSLTGHQEAMFIGTLAAAYAEAGRFSEAIAAGEQAAALAAAAGQKELADKNRQLLNLYRAGKPYHEPQP
jgi:protein O-mannosyl-transferase